MAQPSVIRDYLDALPAEAVEELADGLAEACDRYMGQGLTADEAASAAVSEFGSPRIVVRAFADASAGRRAGRRLLKAGPVVGVCWGIALVTEHAWTWQVPLVVRAALALGVFTAIGLLAVAAFSANFRAVRMSGAAACAVTGLLDAAVAGGAVAVAPVLLWPLALAVAVSALRFVFAAASLSHAIARWPCCR